MDAVTLTDIERRLCDGFVVGETVVCENGERVRAEVLTDLLLGERGGQERGNRKAIPSLRLTGARITGQLQLGFATVEHPLLLDDCRFDEVPDLYWARMDFVRFVGCTMPGLRASNISVSRHLQLSRSTVNGEVRLSGGRIAGGLLLDEVKLSHSGPALVAERMEIGGDLILEGVVVSGRVRLYQSSVGGGLNLDRAEITNPADVALGADSITVAGGLYAREATITGEVSLRHARIEGAATFTSSRLSNCDGVTLRADRANIEGGLWLAGSFYSDGMIRLVSAQIGRGVVLNGAILTNAGGTALLAEGANIDGGFDAREVSVDGTIDLRESTIAGPVQFQSARLNAPGGRALDAGRATFKSTFGCNDGFVADGLLRFSRATIGDILSFGDATIGELRCWRLTTPELQLHWREAPQTMDLRYCHVGVLGDSPSMWPASVRLDGFHYDAVEDLSALTRLSNLERDSDGYRPQPYEQLAAICRRLGYDDDARTVLLTKQRCRTSAQPWAARLWGLAQDAVVGYGYRPLRAAIWLVLLLTMGTVAFTNHPPFAITTAAPDFLPAVYTADVLLPLIDLGQESAFQPSNGYRWLMYALMIAGWILVTTVAAGVARSLRRD